jgi:phage shock protein A
LIQFAVQAGTLDRLFEALSGSHHSFRERRFIMGLLERVGTLIRANINDMVDRAEDPEKMIKQVILDMQNQLLQVKTQVAIAIADQHLLTRKQKENEDRVAEWMRKAELSVDKKKDDLARAALQRVESYRDLSEGFAQQVTDQKAQVENLKTALRQLEQKLAEAQAKADLLIAQHRRARAVSKASEAKMAAGNGSSANAFDRMKRKVAHAEAHSQAKSEVAADDVEERLAALEKEDRIDQLLAELKTKRGA